MLSSRHRSGEFRGHSIQIISVKAVRSSEPIASIVGGPGALSNRRGAKGERRAARRVTGAKRLGNLRGDLHENPLTKAKAKATAMPMAWLRGRPRASPGVSAKGHPMVKLLSKAMLEPMLDSLLSPKVGSLSSSEPIQQRNRVLKLIANHLSNHMLNHLVNPIASRLFKQMLNQMFHRLRNRMSNHLANQVTNHLLNHLPNRLVNVIANQLFNRNVRHLRNLVVNHQANEALKGYPGGGLGERCLACVLSITAKSTYISMKTEGKELVMATQKHRDRPRHPGRAPAGVSTSSSAMVSYARKGQN